MAFSLFDLVIFPVLSLLSERFFEEFFVDFGFEFGELLHRLEVFVFVQFELVETLGVVAIGFVGVLCEVVFLVGFFEMFLEPLIFLDDGVELFFEVLAFEGTILLQLVFLEFYFLNFVS